VETQENHTRFMKLALAEAEKAGQIDEVPIGALIVSPQGEILASAHNRTIAATDPTAHAEILALRAAAAKISNYRLLGATIYVTIEPCAMCMGALVHARVATLVYGAGDPKWGAAESLYCIGSDERLNHRLEIVPGVLEADCRDLMQRFFREKRRSD